MAKLNLDPIEKTDIVEYLDEYSDFSFELKVLNLLCEMGFSCEHSGIYEDPITKKTREFDIRARKSLGFRHIKLSVECKNFRSNFPLVAHCTQRIPSESYHNVLVRNYQPSKSSDLISERQSDSEKARVSSPHSLYLESEYVAKSIDQVGRSNNGIVSNDGSVFEKINQAIHSAYDLIEEAHYDIYGPKGKAEIILPILVIPDDRLWAVRYDDSGARVGDIELVEHLTYYVGQQWRVGYINEQNPSLSNFTWYTLSHLEVITFSALNRVLNEYFNPEENWGRAFTKMTPDEWYSLKQENT